MFSFKKKNTPESVAKEKAAFIESIRNKYKGQEEFVLTDEEAAVVGRPSFIKKLRSFENGAIFEKVSGIYRLGDNIKDYPNFVVCVGAYVTEYPKMYENGMGISGEKSSQEKVTRISLEEYNRRYEEYTTSLKISQLAKGKIR